MTTTIFHRHQRGMTLIDALIGMLVLSIGLAGAAKLQSWMRVTDDNARQSVQAVRLAQTSFEQIRAGQKAGDPLPGFSVEQKTLAANTQDRELEASNVTVRWDDRKGDPHAVRLATLRSLESPAYSVALSLPQPATTVSGRGVLPANATIVDARRGIVKSSSRSAIAWQVDAATGLVSARCSVDNTVSSTALGLSDLRDCKPAAGNLLSGYIRFSTGNQPNAVFPNDKPLDATVALAVESVALQPECDVEAVQSAQGNYLSYLCVVQHDVSSAWSGRLQIVPVGWTLGTTSADHKVCRYSADFDASGRIDQNAEHPARYENVRGPLRQQNYLVIRGDLDCPTAQASQSPQNAIIASTVQHQP